jgi:hypothetical protein
MKIYPILAASQFFAISIFIAEHPPDKILDFGPIGKPRDRRHRDEIARR